MSKQRKILVSSALPYANGSLHIGHMVEHVQTDIWTSALKMRGHQCYSVCADDAHGTPIMLRAEEQGITPETLIDTVRAEHLQDLKNFGVIYDNYSSTHSQENQQLVERFYTALQNGDHISTKTVKQFYDPEKNMFLSDRFVRGTCPRCQADDQYGDSCEICGSTYAPTELINPRSAITGAQPIEKESLHYFVKLGDFQTMLETWCRSNSLQPEITNKLEEWFTEGLRDWDISRDEPYFGFKIPNSDDKYFYVWLDAPIGYLASFQQLCARENIDFEAWLSPDSATELYHFIGKDITYFHTLFWPAMLYAANFKMPTAVYVHGFLTVNNLKMSKTRGTFINASTYLEHLNPDYLRYYFAAKLGPSVADIDLNLEDFVARVNSDLVGKLINIASRCAGFINKKFDNRLADSLDDTGLFQKFTDAADTLADLYETREYNQAMRMIMALADDANRYIDGNKPWIRVKDPEKLTEVHKICTQGINMFKILMVYLKPVIPFTTAKAETFLNIAEMTWEDSQRSLLNHNIRPFKALMTRVESDKIEKLVNASKETLEKKDTSPAQKLPALSPQISIDEFSKIDLRIAKIIDAETIEGADKLLRLTVDIGIDQRQVLAGIKSAYSADELKGRLTVVVANLAPRKMRFGVSQGMVLAAGPGGNDLFLLSPDSGASAGMRVK